MSVNGHPRKLYWGGAMYLIGSGSFVALWRRVAISRIALYVSSSIRRKESEGDGLLSIARISVIACFKWSSVVIDGNGTTVGKNSKVLNILVVAVDGIYVVTQR